MRVPGGDQLCLATQLGFDSPEQLACLHRAALGCLSLLLLPPRPLDLSVAYIVFYSTDASMNARPSTLSASFVLPLLRRTLCSGAATRV